MGWLENTNDNMKKKKERPQFLQEQFDEKNYQISFDYVMSIKGIDSTHKLVINLMFNDAYMNEKITWKQSTYADKLGLSRQQMSNIFNLFLEKNILVPDKNNKPGSKQNKYGMNIHNIKHLVKKKAGFKKGHTINTKKEPVNPDVQTCKPQFTQPVKPDVQTCKEEFTYNTSNTSSNTCNTESDDSLLLEESSDKPKKTLTNLELELFAQNLD